MPELVESYLPKAKVVGRPAKEPFDPYKEIPENVHRAALDAVFADGNIGSYDDYLERLKKGYGLQGVKLGHNKAVKVATCLAILSPLLEIYLTIRMPIPYPHSTWLAGKYQQVTVARYAKV